ncbi:MAG: MFS transporter, partial [Candidatus Acidiferrales bacterium]
FVAAVAWLAELFPAPKQRERVLGYTQFFSSIGGLMVAYVNYWIVQHSLSFPAISLPDWLSGLGAIDDSHAAWRYTLMSGLVPALPLAVIRPFLPESPTWRARKAAGTLRRPSIGQLFAPDLRRTTIVTTLMFACSYGAAFGAIQQIPQIVPGLPEVREQAQQAVKEAGAKEPAEVRRVAGRVNQAVAADVTKVQEFGGLTGRFLLALLAVRIVSRRALLRVFQVPGLILMPLVFAYVAVTSLNLLYVGIFLAGFVTVAQFSFWGNYLPRVYPVHLRGTGESFAANIGGRLIGTSFAWVTASLAVTADRAFAPTKIALVAAAVGFSVYLVGFIASFWLPEPPEGEVAEEAGAGKGAESVAARG